MAVVVQLDEPSDLLARVFGNRVLAFDGHAIMSVGDEESAMTADTALLIALRPILAMLIAMYIGKPFRAACSRWIPAGKVKDLLLRRVW